MVIAENEHRIISSNKPLFLFLINLIIFQVG